MTLLYILVSTMLISSVSLCGAFLLARNQRFLEKIVFALVGLSTGTLLGGAFFHLIPESLQSQNFETVAIYVLTSFGFFFLIEKLLHWHHCHEDDCDIHALGHMNLIGDSIHNFIDGLIIAAAFIVDVRLGVVTSVALAFHEIPQELGDFAVLTYSGFAPKKAVWFNFLAALTSVLGGIIGFLFIENVQNLVNFLLPIAAGSFIYISASDLIPELKRENSIKKSLLSFVLFFIGIFLMYLLR